MAKSKYCYAVVHKDTGKLLLESGRLPIFWNRKVAQKIAKGFSNYMVEPVLLEELTNHVNTYPA